jgi:HSP90 family molecular chaperone
MRRRLARTSKESDEILMPSFGVGFYSLWSVCGESETHQRIVS